MARTRAHTRKALQEERDALLEELSQPEDTGNGETAEIGDLATSRIEQFVDDRERQRRQDRVEAIEAALLRLDDGTWGVCSECGEKIAGARMEALPTATMCVACAGKRR